MEKLTVYFLCFSLFLSSPVFAVERQIYQSGRAQNTFIELYTSNVKPDCNEALRWMSLFKEKANESELWRHIIPIVMHVDYWDTPGSQDIFAKKPFNDLLLQYRKKWNSTYVFVPTIVVNGTEWGGWSKHQALPKNSPRKVGILKAVGSGQESNYRVEFYPEKELISEKWTVHAALLAFDLRSKEMEGDNRDNALTHDFIAMHYREAQLKSHSGVYSANIEIAPDRGLRGKEYAIVFWVTETGDAMPVQCTGGHWTW